MQPTYTGVLALALCFASSGCVGKLDAAVGSEQSGSGAAPAGGADAPPGATDPSPTCAGVSVSSAPMRRLTRDEYDNTVRDVLGLTSEPAREFPRDEAPAGFAGNSITPVTQRALEAYLGAAHEVALSTDVPALLPCMSSAPDDACARSFVLHVGRRLFRRALEPSELDDLLAVFSAKRDMSGFEAGIRLVLETMLASPSFLYRPEVGSGRGVSLLSGYELASRLSFFLWGSSPDETLLDAAENGALATRDGVQQQALRLLSDARARDAVQSFFAQWLRVTDLETLDKNPSLFPEFPELATSMRAETAAFVDHVVFELDGSLRTLLTAPFSVVDAKLASFYGAAPGQLVGFARTELPAGQRAGLLTQASFLAVAANGNQGSPILRGKFVREHLLCQDLAPPPPDAVVVPPEIDPSVSTRERFEQHRADPACRGCHELMDPIGYGFLRYDAIGRFLQAEPSGPIDDTGELVAAGDASGPFRGPIELGQRLSESPDVQRCLATHLLRFAVSRRETQEENCSIDEATQAFRERDLDVIELMYALVVTDAFRYLRSEELTP
jgi:hypothetical protein